MGKKTVKAFSHVVLLFFQKEIPLCQLQFKKKNNSLRIISAVIESMKYWREHAQNAVLLFEILGMYNSSKLLH